MSFENLIKIIGGTLLNTPLVGKFKSIHSNPKKIKLGDLFLALDANDIDKALENGAYGIVYDFNTPIKDSEIAWIRVDDLDSSLKKLLRFTLLKRSSNIFYFDSVEFEIAKSITKRDDLIFLNKDMVKNFKKIINADENAIIISKSRDTLKDIYPNFKTLNRCKKKSIQVTNQTLFLSSFTYKECYYENLKISAIFIDKLADILNFLDEQDRSFNLKSIDLKNHFKPIFISDKFQIKHFGDSQHVIIIEESKELLKDELSYIKEYATWAESIEMDLNKLQKEDIDKFNFILIKANYNELIKYLEKFSIKSNNSLFMEL